ncbi:hypothetical protein [Acinetobacter beijerinckii]|uniref:Uncharacterized protein n=1 Tax=Acinetobacter beijerinckii CIP 110307 TaxID=1217648 RepID=N9FDN8_9GAMM|nr:hypothetical protein [Acinetobacter beijerinckii]ENW02974.1 hypothetical protein F933_03380 [Acinetobacter beijerinckii CIP 110307]
MSQFVLQEKQLQSLMADGALEYVKFHYEKESNNGELSLWFFFNSKFQHSSRSLKNENGEVKTWRSKEDATAYLRSIGYTGDVGEAGVDCPEPENDDFLLKRAEHAQDYNQFKNPFDLAAELIFDEFADRFNAVEDIQENNELSTEIKEEVALLITKALEYWNKSKKKNEE